MREARGKIKKEFLIALEEFPTENKDNFTAQEYVKFKNFEDEQMGDLWKEVDVFAIGSVREIISKNQLAHGLTQSYIKQSEIFQELCKERKQVKKIEKQWRKILYEQEQQSQQFQESQLKIEIKEFKSTAKNLKTSFQLKFMFENKIFTSKILKDKIPTKEIFEFKVRDSQSILHIQLINFGVIGRGSYKIKTLIDQQEKYDNIKIFNDNDEQIGIVKVKLHWIHDVSKLITLQLQKQEEQLNQQNNQIQNIQKKINILESIAPKIKNYQHNINDLEKPSQNYIHLFFLFILLGINLIINWVHPNTGELMFVLMSFAIIYSPNSKDFHYWYLLAYLFFSLKDVISLLFFQKEDYSQMISKFYFGILLRKIANILYIASAIIKVTYVITIKFLINQSYFVVLSSQREFVCSWKIFKVFFNQSFFVILKKIKIKSLICD